MVAVVAAVFIVAAATGGAAALAAGALGAMLGAAGNDSTNHSPQDPRSSTHGQNSMSIESQNVHLHLWALFSIKGKIKVGNFAGSCAIIFGK